MGRQPHTHRGVAALGLAAPGRLVFTRVAWSLCYEEQFYFVCFLTLLIAPRRLYGALTAVSVCAVLLRIIAADIGRMSRSKGRFPPSGTSSPWAWRSTGGSTSLGARSGRDEASRSRLALLAVAGAFGNLATPVPYSSAITGLFGLRLDRPPRLGRAGRRGELAPPLACLRPALLQHLPRPSPRLHGWQSLALRVGLHQLLGLYVGDDPGGFRRRGRGELALLLGGRAALPQPADRRP